MTTIQAAELRVKWKQRLDPSECKHLNLELECNNLGHSTDNYVCTVCGEPAAQRPSRVASPATLCATKTSLAAK